MHLQDQVTLDRSPLRCNKKGGAQQHPQNNTILNQYNINQLRSLKMTEQHEASNKVVTKESNYWNNFYAKCFSVDIPSQFCTMFATEADRTRPVVEFGCGNGRDSVYLARHGFRVFAGDLSAEAVARNRAREEEPHDGNNDKLGHHPASFRVCDVAQARDVEALLTLARGNNTNSNTNSNNNNNIAIYNRFFLHSLDDDQEHKFLTALSDHTQPGDTLYMEYRCSLDAALDKVHGQDHYRRYVDTDQLKTVLSRQLEFDVQYDVTGQGMAKYKTEDPFVSRIIAIRR